MNDENDSLDNHMESKMVMPVAQVVLGGANWPLAALASG